MKSTHHVRKTQKQVNTSETKQNEGASGKWKSNSRHVEAKHEHTETNTQTHIHMHQLMLHSSFGTRVHAVAACDSDLITSMTFCTGPKIDRRKPHKTTVSNLQCVDSERVAHVSSLRALTGMSSPRAATSVATRIGTRPLRNCAKALSRSCCERSPWIEDAWKPDNT
jgi:hypothetical protein